MTNRKQNYYRNASSFFVIFIYKYFVLQDLKFVIELNKAMKLGEMKGKLPTLFDREIDENWYESADMKRG